MAVNPPSQDRGGIDATTRTLLLSLFLADLAYAYQQTAVLPAIGTVERSLHVPTEWGAWILSGYLMVATVATPALGRLADMRGRRQLMIGALAVFLLGSVGATIAPDFPLLVAFRAVQGLGGIVLPLSMSILRDRLPAGSVNKALGWMIGAFGLGTTLGFGLGGVLASAVNWRLTFGSGAVAIAVALALVVWAVPPGGGGSGGRFDVRGAALLGTCTASLLLALTLGVELGWATPAPLALFVLSAAAGGWWVHEELTVESPLLDLRLLRNRRVGLANLASIGLGWARFAAYLLLPDLAESNPARTGVGFSAGVIEVGLLMVPDAVGQMVFGPLAAPLSKRFGPDRVFAAGLAVLGAGMAVLAAETTSLPQLVVASALSGSGAGLAVQSSSAVVTQDIDGDLTATSTSLNSTIRRFTGGIGSQVSTALLLAMVVGAGVAPARPAFEAAYSVAAGLCVIGAAAALAIRGGGS